MSGRYELSNRHSWFVPSDSRRLPSIRNEASAWLQARGVPRNARTDLLIVLSELVSNAITAARMSVAVRLELDQDHVSLEVEDDGPGHRDLDQQGRSAPEITAITGRGLFIVRKLADQVTVTSTGAGSLIRATCPCT